jgi:hypothetical protein
MSEYRRARADFRAVSTDPLTGRRVKLEADENGVVTIRNAEQRRFADSLGLHVTELPKVSSEDLAESRKKREAD